ncbi:major facilitator superfamily domain-containing protein 8-like isoform X2 [Mercenaria mercenaria]|uniref:major facilitator superfamily domain-containing protein 8-like isoform X2 n=1 Tax=Mercenaria mercenaria TaxID=6596 RepID=UPI00234F83A3|nr:major facilitator superfamily domain-containing protein 8-like isoform X2 [Mercenaria mercenaria]
MESSVRYVCNDADERTLLLSTSSSSSESRHKATAESQGIYRSRWRSIRVMYLTMFLSSVSFSICMSSLYPYLRILDPGANTNFLGWVVASYSVGQLVASPFFGAWSNIRSRTREPLVVSIVINVLANVLYMYLESIQKHAQVYLLLARAFVGFGAGNIAVVRSYVAGATKLSERISVMANLSAFQSAGFISVFQTAMVPLGYPGPVHSADFHFDMYSATGLFSALVGIINILLLILVFKEHSIISEEYKYPDGTAESTSSTNAALNGSCAESSQPSSPDYIAILTTIFLFFSVLFIFAVFETIVTPLGMDMFAWKKAKATLYVGLMLGCAGVVAIVVFTVIKLLAKRFNERNLLLCGFVICIIGYVSYLPWGHNYPAVQYAEIGKAETTTNKISNSTMIAERKLLPEEVKLQVKNEDITKNLKLSHERKGDGISAIEDVAKDNDNIRKNTFQQNGTMLAVNTKILKGNLVDNIIGVTRTQFENVITFRNVSNRLDEEAVGCPYYFDWCMYTPVIFLWQYLLGTFFIAVGYSACSVISYTIFSKVLGPKPQGLWMGWLTASGSLARALGPVFVTQVYDAFGPRVAFSAMTAIIIIAIITLLIIYKRLVPYRAPSQ